MLLAAANSDPVPSALPVPILLLGALGVWNLISGLKEQATRDSSFGMLKMFISLPLLGIALLPILLALLLSSYVGSIPQEYLISDESSGDFSIRALNSTFLLVGGAVFFIIGRLIRKAPSASHETRLLSSTLMVIGLGLVGLSLYVYYHSLGMSFPPRGFSGMELYLTPPGILLFFFTFVPVIALGLVFYLRKKAEHESGKVESLESLSPFVLGILALFFLPILT